MVVCDHNCEYLGLSRLCLMENAGKSLSDEVTTLSTFKFSKPVKIIIFAGSGGNGGDGFVAARHLLNRGFEVQVYSLASPDEVKSVDSLINLEILMNLEPRISRLSLDFIKDSADLDDIDFGEVDEEFIVLDCLLGTGIKGKLKAKVRKTVELINNVLGLTVAVDIPSGLDPLTGEIEDIAVKADYTVSFHKVKTGIKIAGEKNVGGIITCDIGIPLEAELFVEGGDLLRFKSRKFNSHKGQNGSILVVGGSEDYYGAPAIASKAAIALDVERGDAKATTTEGIVLDAEKCIYDGACALKCPTEAIRVVTAKGMEIPSRTKDAGEQSFAMCVRCGACTAVCDNEALKLDVIDKEIDGEIVARNRIIYNPSKCNSCGDCIDACPYDMLHEAYKVNLPIAGFCTLCEKCIEKCKSDALCLK